MLWLATTLLLQVTPAPPAAAPPRATPAPAPAQAPAQAPAGEAAPKKPANDAVRVLLPAAGRALLQDGRTGGRMLLFLLAEGSRDGRRPLDAPFFDDPQPMYSVAVDRLAPDAPVVFGPDAVAFPCPLDELEGRYRVQALFDRDDRGRGHVSAGNLVSGEQVVEFRRGRADAATLELNAAIPAETLPTAPNLRFFEMKSALLSRAAGHDVFLRAGVALPPGWADPNHRRRMFPAIYVIPGFGGNHLGAAERARMLATPGSEQVVPQAVWIVLDPDAPLGHHGFVDSAANGPRGKALIEELIPELERNFRLIARADARIVTGHSSGGWSALWLQLTHPETFGACFASSPDPVDFSAFQCSDLYRDPSLFSDADGKEIPSFRTPLAERFEKVRMTVRQEAAMERVLGPARDSGEQWDAWAAMWSAVDPQTRLPRPMFDNLTGAIDHGVVENDWSRYDIARRLRANPARDGRLMRERVRLLCGGADNFYLDRAVARLRGTMEEIAQQQAAAGTPLPSGSGYIEIVPDETHDAVAASSMLRWQREMRQYLAEKKLD
ncbi:MAG: alpha/beta hydrolase-fold protein [Phycisphaerales bacterium]